MIVDKEIEIKCNTRNIKKLRKRNINIKIGDEVIIPIEDLSLGSNKKIKVRCDNCKKEKEISYYDYNKITNNQTSDYYCIKCKNIKTKQTNLKKYGVENVFQNEDIKKKIKKTCMDKYGTKHHLQNKEILKKQQETNFKKYGVDFIPQLNKPLHTNDSFKKEAKLIHNNKYNYDLVDYINGNTEVIIKCPIHGEFKQLAKSHLEGHGCYKCSIEKLKISKLDNKEKFIEKSEKVHGKFYDYSKVIYINSYTKVIIICPIHGEFKQRPQDHINSGNGCPICKQSKGELKIRKYLKEKNIKIEEQKKFKECKNINSLPFDFYLTEYNMCIEFDGEQHFKIVERWGGEEGLKERKLRDEIKNKYCKKNNIKLIRIKYNENIEEKLKEIFKNDIN